MNGLFTLAFWDALGFNVLRVLISLAWQSSLLICICGVDSGYPSPQERRRTAQRLGFSSLPTAVNTTHGLGGFPCRYPAGSAAGHP